MTSGAIDAPELTVLDVRPDVLSWARSAVQPVLRAAVDSLSGPMRHISGYHFGWWDERGRPADAFAGKAIRPALALLSAAAVGGDTSAAVPAAVAVELVHNFSLLHDDVMDGDATRRHRPTAWRIFGADSAILAGDALLALALEVIAASGHPVAGTAVRELTRAVQQLLAGQSADLSFEDRSDVDIAECVRMAEGKTGALLGAACGLGAWYGGADADRAGAVRRFGERLGLAFQHVDDLLGIWGEPARTGKPVHSDLRSRKKSLPVVAALASGTPAGRELAEWYATGQPSPGELARAAELVERAGGRAWSATQAEELVAEALRQLASADPDSDAAEELAALARLATRRDR